MNKYLITGGAGFIGSHFTRLLVNSNPSDNIVVLDALTYAGNLENLADIQDKIEFMHGDILDKAIVTSAMMDVDYLVHFAAETHNDRAILDAGSFIQTDVYGTFVLLEAARKANVKKFLHISTDEVYGSITSGQFTEESPIQPNMPYAASKAGAELMARAYYKTHGLPVIIARPSNNFGTHQNPEKMMPLFITNTIENKTLPMYGSGEHVRDWIFVEDTCAALQHILEHGAVGEAYNIGVNGEKRNIDVAKQILKLLSKPENLINFVEDRPGHDVRYALNANKLKALGWSSQNNFDTALEKTVRWYVENKDWWQSAQARNKQFLDKWYQHR